MKEDQGQEMERMTEIETIRTGTDTDVMTEEVEMTEVVVMIGVAEMIEERDHTLEKKTSVRKS